MGRGAVSEARDVGSRPARTVLLDTHVMIWWTSDPDQVSPAAALALSAADELAVASITWYELAWLAEHGRLAMTISPRTWLDGMAQHVRTVALTPAIAAAAAALPDTFPGDPADRIIYATAMELGCQVVTKDRRLRDHPAPRPIAIW
ncbi:MAG: type II toxin-antitoxin system VapC family toxin [Chloroflexota bacterium]